MSNRSKQIAAVVVVAIGIISIWAVGWYAGKITRAALLAVAPDVIPTFAKSIGVNTLWEDGSFIISPLNLFSITGCLPFHPWNGEIVSGWCMDGGTSAFGHFKRGAWVWTIGVDSPWEDFMPEPFSSLMYGLVEFLIKSRYQ